MGDWRRTARSLYAAQIQEIFNSASAREKIRGLLELEEKEGYELNVHLKGHVNLPCTISSDLLES